MPSQVEIPARAAFAGRFLPRAKSSLHAKDFIAPGECGGKPRLPAGHRAGVPRSLNGLNRFADEFHVRPPCCGLPSVPAGDLPGSREPLLAVPGRYTARCATGIPVWHRHLARATPSFIWLARPPTRPRRTVEPDSCRDRSVERPSAPDRVPRPFRDFHRRRARCPENAPPATPSLHSRIA